MKDLARIFVKGGDGGDGSTHFRREKYAPKGGPDGGDGGKGGDVILVADENIENLVEFNFKKIYEADNGDKGSEKRSSGGGANDLEVRVPVGTEIYSIPPEYAEVNLRNREKFEELMKIRTFVVDMDTHDKRIIIGYGGDGGRGNWHFKSSTHQTPLEHEDGHPGEQKWLLLEQKVIADIGIIGLPNVGKSSILKSLTRANPKIAGYPFTTLEPNLGVMSVGKGKSSDHSLLQGSELHRPSSLILVDVPGVVEEAYEGKGIGPWFLRHIERAKKLMHVLAPDPTRGEDYLAQMVSDYKIVRKELEKWGKGVDTKEEIVVINKKELIDDSLWSIVGEQFEKKTGKKVVWVSAGMGEVNYLADSINC